MKYSTDDEEFVDLDDILDILEDDSEIEYVYVGNERNYKHSDFIDVRNIKRMIQDIQDEAYEIAEEYSESYLKDLKNDDLIDLSKIMIDWFDKHAEQPTFMSIYKTNKISKSEFLESLKDWE